MKILVVEDEIKIATALKRGLERQHFVVETTGDGVEAYNMISTSEYDLIILDRMIPSMDGLSLLKKIRSEGVHTPLIFLTAKDKVLDKMEGLNHGADDYLVKPFAFVELLARVRALLRRPKTSIGDILSYEDLTLNTTNMVAERSGHTIDLTPKESKILEYLMRHSEQYMSKQKIIDNVWEFDSEVLPSSIEVYIAGLRKKIDKTEKSKFDLIQSKKGVGYCIKKVV